MEEKKLEQDFKKIIDALQSIKEHLEHAKIELEFLSECPFPTTVKIDKDGKPVTINEYCKNVLKGLK